MVFDLLLINYKIGRVFWLIWWILFCWGGCCCWSDVWKFCYFFFSVGSWFLGWCCVFWDIEGLCECVIECCYCLFFFLYLCGIMLCVMGYGILWDVMWSRILCLFLFCFGYYFVFFLSVVLFFLVLVVFVSVLYWMFLCFVFVLFRWNLKIFEDWYICYWL